MRIPMISLIAVAATALGGCAYGYGDYGYGGYGGYGYSPYGYGSPYYGAGSYYGWYDDFYYPGVGVYVYDVHRRRHTWNDRQRSYWSGRRDTVMRSSGARTSPVVRENWSGFNRQRPGRRH
jgi:hypothetical protein